MDKYIEMRRLVIKAFHIEKVEFSEKTYIEDRVLYINKDRILNSKEEYIKALNIDIINPDKRDIYVNSIMDFSPIATKVLGRIGEGITHVLTGVCTMLTGVDEDGIQVAEFGSSEGILNEQVVFDRPGTPAKDDILIHVDVVLKSGMGATRKGPEAAHRVCDSLVQEIRGYLKNMNGRFCDEKHEYVDTIRPNGKKVVIIKQVAGQGSMYDTRLFGNEPCGYNGGKSIIDMGNVPIVLTPNEYRDGALRAMH
ncbi:proline reductase cluster protein PrdD [Sporanaerobacter acetigenes]|uniref:proline reductase cluster protein PrdD n=1 Tax=Sporanaerobacter acetigenes TaxID=165813 RepID=UPI00105330B2|nr:proline reductase cluster protein PrdD [Sporanaerobacter acetigenes]